MGLQREDDVPKHHYDKLPLPPDNPPQEDIDEPFAFFLDDDNDTNDESQFGTDYEDEELDHHPGFIFHMQDEGFIHEVLNIDAWSLINNAQQAAAEFFGSGTEEGPHSISVSMVFTLPSGAHSDSSATMDDGDISVNNTNSNSDITSNETPSASVSSSSSVHATPPTSSRAPASAGPTASAPDTGAASDQAAVPDTAAAPDSATSSPRESFNSQTCCGNCEKNLFSYSQKKAKRVKNHLSLQSDEEESDTSASDIFSPGRSGFTDLFQSQEASRIWDEFMQAGEEQQVEILEAVDGNVSRRRQGGMHGNRQQNAGGEKDKCIPEEEKKMADMLRRLSRKQTSLVEQRHFPQGILRYLEEEVITAFTVDPTMTYISEEMSSFERLILHTVATFYNLVSESFTTSDNRRLIRINTQDGSFAVPEVRLSDYILKIQEARNNNR